MKSRPALLKLGERISLLRRKRGITLEKLAYEMDLSKGNLSDIEKGKKDPRYSTLLAIAEGLNMSVADLLRERT
ncbi:MAG: helix-turn-helix domain-containing protein [Bacteriovoracia bacterium]